MDTLLAFLRRQGADTLAHPGGTLLAHLLRARELVRAWGADEGLQALALCHAFYGTDGFATALLSLDRRGELVELVGAEVERQVYLYASCDRRKTYPRLRERPQVGFHDRFTGETRLVGGAELRAFAELTAANELDVALHAPGFVAEHGPGMARLLRQMDDLLSEGARRAWGELLARGNGP